MSSTARCRFFVTMQTTTVRARLLLRNRAWPGRSRQAEASRNASRGVGAARRIQTSESPESTRSLQKETPAPPTPKPRGRPSIRERPDAFLLGRAWTAIARGRWMQALPDAEKVVDARPGAPEPLALLARIKARTESPEAALATLDGANTETAATKIVRAQDRRPAPGECQRGAHTRRGGALRFRRVGASQGLGRFDRGRARLPARRHRRGVRACPRGRRPALTFAPMKPSSSEAAQLPVLLGVSDEQARAKEVLKRLSSGPSQTYPRARA